MKIFRMIKSLVRKKIVIPMSDGIVVVFSDQIEEFVRQLVRERDAAVAALAVVRSCETCKHAVMPGSLREYVCMADDYDCATCEASDCACKTCEDGSGWVFGGVKRDG